MRFWHSAGAISESRLNLLAVGNRSSLLQLNSVKLIVKFTIISLVEGVFNADTSFNRAYKALPQENISKNHTITLSIHASSISSPKPGASDGTR